MAPKEASILENGNGLFDTHVHLEDVQEAIGEQMNTTARLGEGTKYTVVGDGNGFMSRVVLVEADWTVPDDSLPSKFILKLASCLHVHAIADKMRSSGGISEEMEKAMWAMFEIEAQKLHNREVNLYKILETWNKNDVMLSPKIYFTKQFDEHNKLKGFLGMEFVDDVTIRHLYVNAKPQELHPVLKALAHLQAGSLNLSNEQRESITGYSYKEMMGQVMNEQGMKGLYEQTREINKEKLTDKTDKIEAFGLEIVNFELACNLNKYVGIKHDVLVHGDLWAANILWKKESENEFSVSKLIDYQLIHMGNPAEDLVRLFISTLSGADRQKYWEKLLEQFYDYFLEALGDQEVPYSLEQLKESFRNYFVSGGLIMMPLFGPVAQMKLSMSNCEDVVGPREVLTEKTECLLDDLEHWHLYSKDTTKNAVL